MELGPLGVGDGTRESALLRFAAFVRENPSAVHGEPSELAARFSLPEAMVRESLEAAGHPPKPKRRAWARVLDRGVSWTQALGDAIGRFPYVAAVFAGFAWGFLNWFLEVFSSAHLQPGKALYFTAGIGMLAAINFLGGRARYALPTSAIMAAIATLMVLMMSAGYPAGPASLEVFAIYFVRGVVNFVVGLAPLSLGMAFAGAYRRYAAEQRNERRKDRLFHLQRVFALQDQLAEAENADTPKKTVPTSSLPRFLVVGRENWLWFSILAGVFYGLLTVAEAYARGTIFEPGRLNLWAVANAWFFALAYIVLILVAGLLGGTWYKGLIAGLCVVVFSGLVQLWPAPGFGLKFLIFAYSQPGEVVMEFVRIAAAGLAGMSTLVEERNRRLRRIAANDQSALLAEIVRVRQLLESGVTSVCVLAVDCAGSTQMKYGADPLAVEFSFREFHGFIERAVVTAGGSVQSTAGDSAIAQFHSARFAYMAAQEIQARIGEFNRVSNKLTMPFRLRIGLHCGTVHGGLGEVQFSNVIDVASHLQRYAPVGGIAVSDSAAEGLPEVRFEESGAAFGGFNILIPAEYARAAVGTRSGSMELI